MKQKLDEKSLYQPPPTGHHLPLLSCQSHQRRPIESGAGIEIRIAQGDELAQSHSPVCNTWKHSLDSVVLLERKNCSLPRKSVSIGQMAIVCGMTTPSPVFAYIYNEGIDGTNIHNNMFLLFLHMPKPPDGCSNMLQLLWEASPGKGLLGADIAGPMKNMQLKPIISRTRICKAALPTTTPTSNRPRTNQICFANGSWVLRAHRGAS